MDPRELLPPAARAAAVYVFMHGMGVLMLIHTSFDLLRFRAAGGNER